ncbi:MAG: efflux RND transporter periplasmic adaptor subunit [Desulfovibrionales bacterium]|nr:efflux RND transporter periplasmic adaptor subunit [Desulfovibrionales bacterium]
MKKKQFYIALPIFLIAIGVVFYALKGEKDKVEYKTVKVKRGTIASTVLASGTVNPVVLVSVGSQVSGTIEKIYVDFNSRVEKGQIITQIDPAVFQAEVEKARANHKSALANLEQKQAQVTDAKRTFERYRELIKNDLIAQSDVDTAETTYQSAAASFHAAEAAVSQARAALNLAESNLQYTTIRSPVNGIVVSRNVDAGQTVAASFQAPVLFTIAKDLTKMQVDTSVDEADIGVTKPGQRAAFTVDAYPGETFAGKVLQVRNAAQVVQNVVTYDVIVSVDNPSLKLRPGMTANVSILIDERSNVIKIPTAALRFTPPEGERKKSVQETPKGPLVWKLHPDNRLEPVVVKLGIANSQHAELLKGNIAEGDLLATETLSTGKKSEANKSPQFRPF